jgi:hypothetical protein
MRLDEALHHTKQMRLSARDMLYSPDPAADLSAAPPLSGAIKIRRRNEDAGRLTEAGMVSAAQRV